MWIVWTPGSPDPSCPRAAIHHDDPARDRATAGRLAIIEIAPVHHGMTLDQLMTIDAYNLPAKARVEIEGHFTKAVGDGGKRVTTIEGALA